MQISRPLLDEAASRGLIAKDQATALWDFLSERQSDTPTFKPAHILYYLGGAVSIGAMTLFMTLGWERFRGIGLLLIAAGYAVLALLLTESLLFRRRLAVPAGITAALAVAMTPLAVYGAQHALGYWPEGEAVRDAYRDYHARVDGRWFVMELATLGAGVWALWRYRLPFLVMPIAATLWYLSMDLTPLLFGGDGKTFFSEEGKRVSIGFGLAMTLVAFWVDLRATPARDFAFWLYLFGVLTFWGGLTSLESSSEVGRFVYGCLNLLLIAVGAALSRRVFAVFGGIGLAFYLGHLSHTVFRDSMFFPVALTAIGLAVIGAGVVWQRREAAIGAWLRARMPALLRERLEQRATEH